MFCDKKRWDLFQFCKKKGIFFIGFEKGVFFFKKKAFFVLKKAFLIWKKKQNTFLGKNTKISNLDGFIEDKNIKGACNHLDVSLNQNSTKEKVYPDLKTKCLSLFD